MLKKIAKKNFPNFYLKLGKIKSWLTRQKFRISNPRTKILYTTKREMYSQHNQDCIIYNAFFKDRHEGVFCDVGANHPLYINNTRYFEELGWSGYAFEPLKYMQPLWREHRKAVFFSYAASNNNGQTTFTTVKDVTGWEDMLSFVKETNNIKYDYDTEDVIVETRVLKEVFKEENIKQIDYMSIDVEGHELNVIKGIDFSEVRINVLTIENNFHPNGVWGSKEIRRIMRNNNYRLWGRIVGLDDIYVHKEFYKTSQVKSRVI